LLTGAVIAAVGCPSGDELMGHVACVSFGSVLLSPVTVLPGGLLGGLVGSGFPKDEWVSVELSPPADTELGAGNMGLSIRLQFKAPPFP